MERSSHPLPRRHVFVCCNEREGGDCCSRTGSYEVFQALKAWSRSRLSAVWVTRTGCLGFCNPHGATVMVYPDGWLFAQVTVADVEQLCTLILEKND